MGVDIHIHVAKLNRETNLYEEIVLYKPGEEYHYTEDGEKFVDNPDFCRVPIFWGRDSEMFEGMQCEDDDDGYGIFPKTIVNLNSYAEPLQSIIKEAKENYCYGFYETTLADMKNYLYQHPTVRDYDTYNEETKECGRKINPIDNLFDDICSYVSLAEEWEWHINLLSSYKVIFYFDH